MNVGILGLGEIGKAFKEVIAEKYPVYGRDLGYDEIGDKKVDILHVCIPYSDNFVKIVVREIQDLKPRLVIIESTVAVGATRRIANQVKCLIAHSFVRGIHPNLAEGIKTFVKMIGGMDKESAEEADKHFRILGIKSFHFIPPEISEAAKLWDTTYYAWNIIFQKEVWKYCQKNGLDFEIVYDYANRTYNEGYTKLGHPEFIRPVLGQVNGPIGGHCLIPNATILEAKSGNPITKFILNRNKTY